MHEPRLLSKPELRSYLGSLPWQDIEVRIESGQIPRPLWNVAIDDKRARWDKAAVDRALDRLSHAPGTIASQIAELDHVLGFPTT